MNVLFYQPYYNIINNHGLFNEFIKKFKFNFVDPEGHDPTTFGL